MTAGDGDAVGGGEGASGVVVIVALAFALDHDAGDNFSAQSMIQIWGRTFGQIPHFLLKVACIGHHHRRRHCHCLRVRHHRPPLVLSQQHNVVEHLQSSEDCSVR